MVTEATARRHVGYDGSSMQSLPDLVHGRQGPVVVLFLLRVLGVRRYCHVTVDVIGGRLDRSIARTPTLLRRSALRELSTCDWVMAETHRFAAKLASLPLHNVVRLPNFKRVSGFPR